ncbi:MAG: TolC family protein, partial [Candidatus Binatia bacterium]
MSKTRAEGGVRGRALWARSAGVIVRPLTIIWMVTTMAGCSAVGPDYQPPDIATPAEWSQGLRRGLSATAPEAETLVRWWTTLGDADLANLIERARAGNVDLKSAQARIREARGRRGIAESGFYPSFNLAGSASVSRSSEDSGSGMRRELYRTGFDASWEIDVFGGVRRSVEAAQADLDASVADFQDVMVSLLAEVALNYVDART